MKEMQQTSVDIAAAKTVKIDETSGTQVTADKVYRRFEDAPEVNDAKLHDAALFIQNLIRGKAT